MPSMQPLYISATVVAVVMPIMAPLDPVSIYGVAAPAKWAALKGRWAPPPGAQDRREQIALPGRPTPFHPLPGCPRTTVSARPRYRKSSRSRTSRAPHTGRPRNCPGALPPRGGIPSYTGVRHSTVPAHSRAFPESNTPAPTAPATWSWLTLTTCNRVEKPVLLAASGSRVPAAVPDGTGLESSLSSTPATESIFLFQVMVLMSKAIVLVARE